MSDKRSRWLIYTILSVGIFLRVFQFPNNPPGLYVDEAFAGYEAYSLLHTGADEWGLSLPVYFISSGSGQSVLYSYLSIPIVSIFGLNPFSIRLLALFISILTLPLLYAAVSRIAGKSLALVATFLLALMPWHVMISRWALDANLLPFFILLGAYSVERAFAEHRSSIWIVISLIPWALALYAYAMAYVVIPVLLLLFILINRAAIISRWKYWLATLILFGVIALPVSIFVTSNFILRDLLVIDRLGPFGIPLLPFNRLEHVSSPLTVRLLKNFYFFISGFQDGEIRNAIDGIAPTFLILFPLSFVGAFALFREFRKSKQANTFLLWLIACLPLFLPADLVINRINAIFIPMLVIGIYGLRYLSTHLGNTKRRVLLAGFGMLVGVHAIFFTFEYFAFYPRMPETELAFFRGFDRAMVKGLEIRQPSERLLVTSNIAPSYILAAFYANYPPEKYQSGIRSKFENEAIQVQSFGPFYFGFDNLPDTDHPFTYVLAKWDQDPCDRPKASLETRLWKVGRCE